MADNCCCCCCGFFLQLTRYRCRKCRQVLFTENNVIPQTGVGRRIFRRERFRQQQQQPADSNDSSSSSGLEQGSVFVEPMWWMQEQVIGPVQGKLYCTNCNARLGSFNWAGRTSAKYMSTIFDRQTVTESCHWLSQLINSCLLLR